MFTTFEECSFSNMTLDDEVQALRNSSKLSGLVTPAYDGRSISNLCDTFSKVLGLSHSRPLKYDDLYGVAESSENLIFLLLDGLGYKLIQHALSGKGGVLSLQSFLDPSKGTIFHPITSVFPSTTSTATTTLHTGLTPQEHGVLGYTMYLEEIGAIAEMLKFTPLLGGRESLFDMGFQPETFINAETIHQKLARNGIVSNFYIQKWIVDSGLSKITIRGSEIYPHFSASDMFVSLRKNLELGRSKFHFAYFASPDSIAHHRGPLGDEFASEVDSLFYILRRELIDKLDSNIAKKTTIIVSADHGLINIEESNIIDVRDHHELGRMLKVPPTGDSRVAFLHAKNGMQDRVIDYFNSNPSFANKFEVASSQHMLERGLLGLGKVKEEVYDRIGSVIAIPKVPVAIENSDIDPRPLPVPGRHGGLSEDEMLVPLIARRLAQ